MASEKTAKFYESLSAVAIKDALSESSYEKMGVFREIRLPGVSIRNDVIVGTKNTEPRIIFLVTHSNHEVHWKEKVPRDLSESIEVICEFPELEGIFYIIFDERTLPGLTKIINYALSGVIHVGGIDPDGVLSKLGHDEETLDKLDALNEEERQNAIREIMASNKTQINLLKRLSSHIHERIKSLGATITPAN